MAKILSTPTSVTVATLPYQPPAPGTAMLIGTNTGADVRPSPDTPDQWSYATMECYGSGTFVADYSSTGAWAVAGCGGHQAAAIYGALIFDFDSATWSYVHNANNFPNRVWSLTASESSSIGEISVSGVTGNMPAPAHVYRYCVGLSKANGGGQRGSLLMTTGAGVDDAGGRQLNYAYKIDLGTGLWSRATTNKRTDAYSGYGYFIEGSAATDPTSRRVYVTPAELSGLTALPYIDLADMTWKAVARGGMTPTDQQCSTFVDVARRLLMFKGTGGNLYAIDLGNIGAGPVRLNVSGSLPSHNNRWDYYPINDSWYTYAGDGSNTISKLTPPASGSPLSGTWSCSSTSIGGATLSPRAMVSGDKAAYTRFFYVPKLQCFAWIAGVTHRVALIKP